jgi:alkylhydroperoxidase/carboxymuconolactone decarboxylase family protein YurZ
MAANIDDFTILVRCGAVQSAIETAPCRSPTLLTAVFRLKKLDENAPEMMKAFWAFDKETFKDGAIDVLHKQLMAVAVAR